MAHHKIKKLTTHDLAFGIGRKATSEEIKELMSRPMGKGKEIEQVRAEIKERLKQNQAHYKSRQPGGTSC